jgi:hypothetical protein
MPEFPTFVNIRTLNYRAYFLPLGVEHNVNKTTGHNITVATVFNHSGTSQFKDKSLRTWNFTHDTFSDTNSAFKPNTLACPQGGHICEPPQCAGTFNLSPYGLWTVQVNPGYFTDVGNVTHIRLQFHIQYEQAGGPPLSYTIFEGGDGVSQQYPVVCCETPCPLDPPLRNPRASQQIKMTGG